MSQHYNDTIEQSQDPVLHQDYHQFNVSNSAQIINQPVYFGQNQAFVEHNQNIPTVSHGTTFYQNPVTQWQGPYHGQGDLYSGPGPIQNQGHYQDSYQSWRSSSGGQRHGNQGYRGARGRGRGQYLNRNQMRLKQQEYHQRFQHDQVNPDIPVEALRPIAQDHYVEEDKTYNDILMDTGGADLVRGRGGGGARQNSGRSRRPHRYDNHPENSTSRQHDGGQYNHNFRESSTRGNPRGNRVGQRGGRPDQQRNHPNQNNGFEKQPAHNNNYKQDIADFDGGKQRMVSEERESVVGQHNKKQIKFTAFHSGSKGGNSSNKSQSRGKGRHIQRLNLANGDLESQRGVLIEQLTSADYECMVCCESVRQDAAVWSCSNCHHVFHLRCVKRWARSPAALEEGDNGGWRCPACQNTSQQFPHHYTCFCGKARDPEWNRFDTPHSCGEVCKKQRSAECIHPCTILCHPGPCPPCHASVTKACDCGKTKQTVKCGQLAPKCVQVCQKQLNCAKHECAAVCHPGACQPCDIVVNQVCYCEKERRDVVCGTAESFTHLFSCGATCGRQLECSHHTCDSPCHPGSCQPCVLRPEAVTHCACGKHILDELGEAAQRTSCVDPVPTCQDICDKKLPCGPKDRPHSCGRVCHVGLCTPCEEAVTPVVCRCALLEKNFSCNEAVLFDKATPFLCDKRCNRKRTCGRHRCPNVCCIEEEHPCSQVCGGKLSCGLHRCEEPCHRGNCPTCWQVSFDELGCHCGAEVLYPPIACGTKPPPCNHTCRRQHNCDHTVRHPCHSDMACPPCTELTERWCMGRHELRKNIACHLTDISCGLQCGKQLRCGLHMCQLICHKGECEPNDAQCQQPCHRLRGECGHPCGVPCHGDSLCPRKPCHAQVLIKCKCANRSERALCQLGGSNDTQEYQKMATMMMAMKMAAVTAGQSIDITSLTTTADGGKKKVRQLECTKDCAILERNKRLALALEIKNPDLQGKLGNPNYSVFLRDFAKQNMSFATAIEKQLSDLVISAQKSKQPRRSHAFAPMNSAQRRVIHELSEAYGCETQSYDVEPKKNVVATAYKDRCWQPNVSLVTAVTREIYPKAPTPIRHGSADAEPLSTRMTTETKSKSTKVKMAPWGKSAIAAKATPEVSEPTSGGAATSWASQVRRSTPPCVDSEKPREAEIDYFDMS